MADLPYRPCVGVMLVNGADLVFAGERIDAPGAWQMPQGGIDEGEAPREAALRELFEETGVRADQVAIEAETAGWVRYDLPDHLVGKLWKGRWRGQEQKWFRMRLLAGDGAIDITAEPREFARWQWMTPDGLRDAIVPFKRGVYDEVFRALA